MTNLQRLIRNQSELNTLLICLHSLEEQLLKANSKKRLDKLLIRHRKILASLAKCNLSLLEILEEISDDYESQ